MNKSIYYTVNQEATSEWLNKLLREAYRSMQRQIETSILKTYFYPNELIEMEKLI